MTNKMRTALMNSVLLLAVAAAGYGLTMYWDGATRISEAPIIHQPVLPLEAIEPGISAPDFEIKDLIGDRHKLSNFRGRVVVLNFWATWCPPCVVEFPLLLQAAAEDPENVVVMALSADLEEAPIHRFLEKIKADLGTNMIIALDENQQIARGLYRSYKLPETYVIGEDGFLTAKLIGAHWKIEDLRALIDAAKKQPSE
jgi:cytochrome c biogenesis protein CcmG/thiol:disulfide interchange protein DsbE